MNHSPPVPRPRTNHDPPPFPPPYVCDNERYSNLAIVIENLKARALFNGYEYTVISSNPVRMQCCTKYCTHGLILSSTRPWTVEVIVSYHVHPPRKPIDYVRDLPESLIDNILRETYWDANRVWDLAREGGFLLSQRGLGNMRKCWRNRYNPKRKASARNWDDDDDASNDAHRPPPPKRHCSSSHAGPSNATAFDTAVRLTAPNQAMPKPTAFKATTTETPQRSPPAPANLPEEAFRAAPNPQPPAMNPSSAPRPLGSYPLATSRVPVADAKTPASADGVEAPAPTAPASHQCAPIPRQQDSLISVPATITEQNAAMTIAHLQSQVAKQEEIIANLRGRITQLEVEKKADATSLGQLGSNIKDLKAEKAQSDNIVDRLRTEHEAELDRVAERTRAATLADFNIELERLRNEHQAELDRVTEHSYAAAQAELNSEIERCGAEYQAELDRVAALSCATQAESHIMRRLPLLAAKRTKLEAERAKLEAEGARESEIARAVKAAICSFLVQDIEEIVQVQEELEDLLKGVQKRIVQLAEQTR